MLLLVWFSPLSIVAWLLGQAVILLQRRWHWWRFTLAALRLDRRGAGRDRPGAGPAPACLRAPALLAVRRPALRLRATRNPHHRQPVPLGPGRHPGVAGRPGRAAGRLAVGVECRAGRRRGRVEPLRPPPPAHRPAHPRPQDRPAAGQAARPQAGRPGARDRLGRRPGQLAPGPLRRPARAAAGQGHGRGRRPRRRQDRHPAPPRLPGRRAGSQGVLRRLQGHRPHPGPGPDRRLPARQPRRPGGLLAGHRHGHVARLARSRWPAGCWRSSSSPSRSTSGSPPPASAWPSPPPTCRRWRVSDELLRRLDVDELAALWEGRPLQLKDIEAIGDHLPGARLRYADFFAALAGAFDRGAWSFEDVDLAVLTVPTLLSKSEADAAMRVVLEDYGHYATGRKPREGEDALLVLDEFSRPRLGRGQRHQPGRAGPRRRRPGRRRRPERRGPGRSPPGPPAAGLLCRRDRRPPVPGPRAAAGPGRDGPHPGAQLGAGLLRPPRASPRPAWGSGPGSTPRPSARPSPAKPGSSRPASPSTCASCPRRPWRRSRSSWRPPSRWPTTPSRCRRSRSRPRSGSQRPSPSPAGSCAGLGSGWAGGGSGAGRLPSPARRPWLVGAAPARSGAAMRPPAGTGLACGAARGNPAPARGPAGCLLDGLPPGRRPRQGRCGTRCARSSRPCGTACGGP